MAARAAALDLHDGVILNEVIVRIFVECVCRGSVSSPVGAVASKTVFGAGAVIVGHGTVQLARVSCHPASLSSTVAGGGAAVPYSAVFGFFRAVLDPVHFFPLAVVIAVAGQKIRLDCLVGRVPVFVPVVAQLSEIVFDHFFNALCGASCRDQFVRFRVLAQRNAVVGLPIKGHGVLGAVRRGEFGQHGLASNGQSFISLPVAAVAGTRPRLQVIDVGAVVVPGHSKHSLALVRAVFDVLCDRFLNARAERHGQQRLLRGWLKRRLHSETAAEFAVQTGASGGGARKDPQLRHTRRAGGSYAHKCVRFHRDVAHHFRLVGKFHGNELCLPV